MNAGKADREKQLGEQTQARRTANVSDTAAHKCCFITGANNDPRTGEAGAGALLCYLV